MKDTIVLVTVLEFDRPIKDVKEVANKMLQAMVNEMSGTTVLNNEIVNSPLVSADIGTIKSDKPLVSWTSTDGWSY